MDTAFQGHPTPNSALPGARALIEGSARAPHPPTAIAPTGTKPRRSVVASHPRGASADGRKRKALPRRNNPVVTVLW